MSRVWVAAVILLASAGIILAGDSASVTFRGGLGYDLLSQQYFLDSIIHSGADSTLAQWALSTDYLDDFKAVLDIRWRPLGARRLEIRGVYEQTSDIMRSRLSADWRPAWSRAKMTSQTELDWKARYAGSSSSGDQYLLGSNRTSLTLPLTERLSIRTKLNADAVRFFGAASYSYDYYRVGGSVGLERQLGDVGMVSIAGLASGRQVIDSQSLSYVAWGGDGSLTGMFGPTDLDLYTRFERRDYQRSDSRDDYSRLDFDLRNRLSIGEMLFSSQELIGDLAWFNGDDQLNSNYQKLSGSIIFGPQYGRFSIGIGPSGEILEEQTKAGLDPEAYSEVGGKVVLDVMLPGRLFGSLESETGRRNLRKEYESKSDFSFERISLLANWVVWRRLEFNALLAGQWEWHRVSTDDSRLILLSSSLTYSF